MVVRCVKLHLMKSAKTSRHGAYSNPQRRSVREGVFNSTAPWCYLFTRLYKLQLPRINGYRRIDQAHFSVAAINSCYANGIKRIVFRLIHETIPFSLFVVNQTVLQ